MTKLAVALACSGLLLAADAKILYDNNLEKLPAGPLPDEFLVLDGAFELKEEANNKFIELPGAPLETFGVLFGPTEAENLEVSARIHAASKGRRAPAFAVSLNGVGGYRLMASPAKKLLELYKSDSVVASAPLDWKGGNWTTLRLRLAKAEAGGWKLTGELLETDRSPVKVEWHETATPVAGRAGIWGSPYSGTPIRFDDLRLLRP